MVEQHNQEYFFENFAIWNSVSDSRKAAFESLSWRFVKINEQTYNVLVFPRTPRKRFKFLLTYHLRKKMFDSDFDLFTKIFLRKKKEKKIKKSAKNMLFLNFKNIVYFIHKKLQFKKFSLPETCTNLIAYKSQFLFIVNFPKLSPFVP